MKRSIFAGVLLMIVVAVTLVPAKAQDDVKSSLIGKWTSLSCELRPGPQHLKRDITIKADRWEGVFPNFADGACKQPTLLFYAEGGWELGKPSEVAMGTYDAQFQLEIVKLTPQATQTVDFLNSAKAGTCGDKKWELNVQQDVSKTGCSVLGLDFSKPVFEYETILVRDAYLFFGARPVDGSGIGSPDKRPTALQVPLIRVK